MSESLEDIEKLGKNQTPTSDLIEVGANVASAINWKLLVLLFLVQVIVFSDVFAKAILEPRGLTTDGYPSSEGTLWQITAVCSLYLALDVADKKGLI